MQLRYKICLSLWYSYIIAYVLLNVNSFLKNNLFYFFVIIFVIIYDINHIMILGGENVEKESVKGLILRLPKQLSIEFKILCARKEISMQKYLIELIEREVKNN